MKGLIGRLEGGYIVLKTKSKPIVRELGRLN